MYMRIYKFVHTHVCVCVSGVFVSELQSVAECAAVCCGVLQCVSMCVAVCCIVF